MTADERKLPWQNPGDRLVLVLVFGALFAVLGVHFALRAGLAQSQPILTPGSKLDSRLVDINTAEWWELQALHGIGQKKAKDIVDHRNKAGPFKSLDELRDVPGIGPKTIAGLSRFVTVPARATQRPGTGGKNADGRL